MLLSLYGKCYISHLMHLLDERPIFIGRDVYADLLSVKKESEWADGRRRGPSLPRTPWLFGYAEQCKFPATYGKRGRGEAQ